ncbi:MAG: class IIb bacteriocin, lactobin A/cerein 7B family [Christensenellaceae bacterium]|nr:class IIb bacteriocin, lactobin A/cerein 7B family [Christensenellaceae bacterium]MBR2223246.1 class IIb bacteriocin, lactobin A/cerein 7B family [Christensenellaceae bacterium]
MNEFIETELNEEELENTNGGLVTVIGASLVLMSGAALAYIYSKNRRR